MLAQSPNAGADVQSRIDQLIEVVRRDPNDRQAYWGAQFDLGLAWAHFPVGRGGLGLSPDWQRAIDNAVLDAGGSLAIHQNGIGVGMCAPAVLGHGSAALAERYLRPLFSCEEIWCQLFSEPSAGSDVASLAMSAVRSGDGWCLNGQKVWSTRAHEASFGLILTRTDPTVPKHRGLTAFVLDMHAPGVDVRPLRQMTGDAEFNEVFVVDAYVPDDHRLGDVGDGWRVALTTLMNERATIGGRAARGDAAMNAIVGLWRSKEISEPVMRDRLMQLWVRAEVDRLTSMRAEQARDAGTPGPEGSVSKLVTTELSKDIHDLAMEILGPESMLYTSYEMGQPAFGTYTIATGDVQKAYLRSRANTIEGGTSEIMRNILGERVLGLPSEPSRDRDVPWADLPRG